MDISKLSKPSASDLSQEAQNVDTQSQSQADAEPAGFAKSDSVERIVSTSLASNLLETSATDNAQQQQEPAAYGGSGSTTVLGQSQNSSPISESYAAKAEHNDVADSANNYSAIRAEIAGALGVSESDPSVDATYAQMVVEQGARHDAARMEASQGIIDAAMLSGRRIVENVKIGDLDASLFTEIVPGGSGDLADAVVRTGTDLTDHGFFGDSTTRMTTYHDASGRQLGLVESVIENGEERITRVVENVAGSIALKPGDTRNVPDPTKTAAGAKPSTWDPQPDGRYGNASGGSTSDGGTTNSSGNSGGATSDGSAKGEGSDVLHSRLFDGAHQKVDSGGTGANSGGTSTEKVHVYHSEDSGKTWEDKGTQWTENPPTKVEVTYEEPESPEGLAEEEEVEAGGDDNQAAWGDYADTGPVPPAQQGEEDTVSTSSGKSYYRAAESRPMFDAEGKSTLTNTDGYVDKPGGPMDFGNANDPNTNEAPAPDGTPIAFGPDPTVTDPGQSEGGDDAATLDSSIRLDMAGTLRDTGNPVDPFATEAPAGNRPSTTDAERSSDDDFLP